MSIIRCTRRLTFEAGHRVFGHENKCANLHGHSYKVFIHACAPALDSVGRVIDFGVIKQRVGTWIDNTMDHATILMSGDPLEKVLAAENQKLLLLPMNPTAENLAQVIFLRARTDLKAFGVLVSSVDVWETENCFASFEG